MWRLYDVNISAEMWIKDIIDGEARSKLEFKLRDLEAANAATAAKKAEKEEAVKAAFQAMVDDYYHLPGSLKETVYKLIADQADPIIAEKVKKAAEARVVEEGLESILAREGSKLFREFQAWQIKNRIAKAIHIVCAIVFCVLASTLFHAVGWDWAMWHVNIVGGIYVAGTLFFRGTVPLSRADWQRYKPQDREKLKPVLEQLATIEREQNPKSNSGLPQSRGR